MSAWFEFSGLSFSVGVERRLVRVSAMLDRGRVMLVRGPSGAGKTTLLRVLARLERAAGGDVWLDGRHWHTVPPASWRAAVCYIAQQPAVFEGTLRDNLRRPFGLAAVGRHRHYDETAARAWMEALMLSPALLEQEARFLSGGEAARMAVVRALLTDPAVLLLDEPTAALDRGTATAFCGVINRWLAEKPDRGAVLVTHDETVAECVKDPVFLDVGGPESRAENAADAAERGGC